MNGVQVLPELVRALCQDQFQTQSVHVIPGTSSRASVISAVLCGMRTSKRHPGPNAPSEMPVASAHVPRDVTAAGAIFFADLKSIITACDQEFSRLLGWMPSDLRRKALSEIFSSDSQLRAGADPLEQTLLDAATSQGRFEAHVYAHTKFGDTVKVLLSVNLVRDARSAPTGMVGIVTPLPAGAALAEPELALDPKADSPVKVRQIDGTQFILASPVMEKFMGLVDRVARHTETVLITGETGTGKELIARTVHESSNRKGKPWVDINCAALPENLVESELFGYEKGAFSGAESSKPGLFELAEKGTLFLDEIGELQLHTQVKLLRVLDGQPFYRLGGHRKIKVDVRIVAATNQDLEAAVREGRFRKDLFHRLGQFQLSVPPLRERPEDIVALAEHFLRLKAPARHFTEDAISFLLSHAWPGNIRELRNLVAKLAMESLEPEIDAAKIRACMSGEPASIRQTASMPVGNLDSMEEQMILKALERTGGHRTLAAEQLGISRRTLSRKLKEYNISFAPGESATALGYISLEQQKFFRARVDLPVTLKNAQGEQITVRGVNLSTGGMGLDGLKDPLRFAGLVDISFVLPDSDSQFRAKARLMWVGDEGRVGVRFAVIEPVLFEQLQDWTNRKMKEEGWDLPS